jgi:DNA-binding IclR family transcriptional regulator
MLLAPGSHVPLHASASGKLLLALLPRPQRERLLEHLTLRGYTEHTLVDRRTLERDLEATRARRVGINRQEHLQGMYGIAVPVMLDRRRACAAVALQAPAGRATVGDLMGHVPKLEAAARRIAKTFGAKVG